MTAHASRTAAQLSPFTRTITTVLRTSWAIALKRVVKNLVWSVKGRQIQNPPLPASVNSALFVCLGNICRSPFAEHVAARRLAAAGKRSIRCASAGITARQSGEVPAHGLEVASTDYGIRLADHRPRLLTSDLIEAFDLVVVMEAEQLMLLRETYPHASQRLFLLSLLDPATVAPHERYHIADPFAQSKDVFRTTFARIDRAVAQLSDQIAARES